MNKTPVTEDPGLSAQIMLKGEVVAFPTETVYGIGALVDKPEALRRIFTLKGRPADNPLILHFASPDQIADFADTSSELAQILITKFFPGALTLILPKIAPLSNLITAGLMTVGVRSPSHPQAQALLRSLPLPVAAPSANLSGKPSATHWKDVLHDFPDGLGAILKGESTLGLESTILDLTQFPVRLLRYGSIPIEELTRLIPDLLVTTESDPLSATPPPSPGMKYRHYAPDGEIIIWSFGDPFPPVTNPSECGYIGLNSHDPAASPMIYDLCVESLEAYAQSLYAFLRECDRRGLKQIICQKPPHTGIGISIYDRLIKASSKI
ncbi:MAG: L-threonylcarbamoyladenylate synthase [Candidatus Caenarcaniphilales bacterium]|nr:L-threonylcarbamoyladenylate synthase [Candidatus Caenarcaniphilales bacterium]